MLKLHLDKVCLWAILLWLFTACSGASPNTPTKINLQSCIVLIFRHNAAACLCLKIVQPGADGRSIFEW